MKKSLQISLKILFALSLSSCAHKIPDEPVCLELNPEKGFCTYTIQDKSFYLNGEAWIKLKNDSLIMPIQSWANIKKFILKICADYNKCESAEKKIKEIEEKFY